MRQVWPDLPVGRAIRLTGASPDALALMLDPLPDGAPAVVTYRPASAPSLAAVTGEALDELERAAIRLFPVWLPGAEAVAGPAGAGAAAVRALARSMAPLAAQYGPFLADLAERALRQHATSGHIPVPGAGGHSAGRRVGFAAEVRAAGLAKVVASAYGRDSAALVVIAPDGLGEAESSMLVGACEWLAAHGRLGVWLTGAEYPATECLMPHRIAVPQPIKELEAVTVEIPDDRKPLPTLSVPAVAGSPASGSLWERALEAALAGKPWAHGRVWHQCYQPTPLDIQRFVDILWEREKLVVEVDGDEHRRNRLKWEADRRRDNRLQRDGYDVLRFPNERIDTDLVAVLHEIETHLCLRRTTEPEGPSPCPAATI
jgi:very-short-patch-repair endonuclease